MCSSMFFCKAIIATGLFCTIEIDIKAKNDQEQAMNREARLDLDTMRAMMNDQQHDEKLEQNEDLAGLRAGVSLAKQTMADQSKIHDFGRNFKKK